MKVGRKTVLSVSPHQPENLGRWINFWMAEIHCNIIQNNNNHPVSSRRLRRIPPTAPSGDFEAPPSAIKKNKRRTTSHLIDLHPRAAPADHHSPTASTSSQVRLPHRATPPGTCIRLCLRNSLTVIATPLLLLASTQLGAVRLNAPDAHTATSLHASTMRFSPWHLPCATPPPCRHRSGAHSCHRPLPAHCRGSRGGRPVVAGATIVLRR
jgi:hypothetical protein